MCPQDDAVGPAQPDGARAAGGRRGSVAAPDELQLAQWRRRPAGDGRRRRGHAFCSVALLVPGLAAHAVWRQWAAWGCLERVLLAQPAVVWEWGPYAWSRIDDARWWDADEHSPAERGDGWWWRFHWCGRVGSSVVRVLLTS